MTAHSDTKQAVLQAVYEDNLGLPRSSHGKRRAPEREHTGDAAIEPSQRLAGNYRTMLVSLALVIALLGWTFFAVSPAPLMADETSVDETSAVEPLTDSLPTTAVALSRITPGVEPPMRLWREVAAPFAADQSLGGGVDQYDQMLSQLSIPMADLFDLNVHTIVIDPGHGGNDPGAVGSQGFLEKDITLDIANRLREKLERSSRYRVLLTREDDSKVKLKDRVAYAKANHADLFISVHINSVPQQAGSVNYVETYYFGPHSDQSTLELARRENRDSDYMIGDFQRIISRIGNTLKTEESAQLASAIHTQLYTNLKTHSGSLLDAGAKPGPFLVLLGVEVPSVLVEVSCISNKAEEARLGTAEYRDSVAQYLESGIIQYLQQRSTDNKTDGVISEHVEEQEGKDVSRGDRSGNFPVGGVG